MLKQNERQASDEAWANALGEIRMGNPSRQVIEMINKRLINGGHGCPTAAQLPRGITVVAVTNEERRTWNNLGVAAYAKLVSSGHTVHTQASDPSTCGILARHTTQSSAQHLAAASAL